jgi:protein kinase C substrate 80K-H
MRAALGLLLLLACCTGGSAAHVRGVRPEVAAKYEGKEFTCLDGSLTLPASAINDDWCQCPDGSDEPGGFCASPRLQAADPVMGG